MTPTVESQPVPAWHRAQHVYYRRAPVRLQMWAHRKRTFYWIPARLAAQALPRSVIYWAVLRAGVEHIRHDEEVPAVPFTEILRRAGEATRKDRR